MKHFDFLVIGAGIFGITTAIELHKRGHRVGVLNPDRIPHPLAASTDISKIVRMEYGADVEYMEMVEACFPVWREWNDLFQETLYHEVGFILLSGSSLDDPNGGFEAASYRSLLQKGYRPERMDPELLARRFPAFGPAT
ncbi:MAG TPA: FAD-dependent oxidoreductase, partial [Flavilitoribacter sp.]|nr:FAD-dependent oxidoreductase [Flavilitoribacter sp.]